VSADDAEDRRGTDGKDLPLDFDARFAAIVAHFHDDEPRRPQVVDASAADGDLELRREEPASDDVEGHLADERPGERPDDRPGDGDLGTGLDDPRWRAAAADLDALDLLRDGPDTAPERQQPPPAAPRVPPLPPLSHPDPRPASRHAPRPLPRRDGAAPHLETHEERLARIEREVERAVHGADGGHYVPPEPPPIPRPVGLASRAAWTSVLLGPVLLLLCALLWRDSTPEWVLGTLVVAVVAGFTYLVWRLPHSRDRDDPDDGAIV
jgi:hypothetical protein